MSADKTRKYLKSLHVMEAYIHDSKDKNRKSWLNKVKSEKFFTEIDLRISIAEERAHKAEENLKNVVEFIFQGAPAKVRERMRELAKR